MKWCLYQPCGWGRRTYIHTLVTWTVSGSSVVWLRCLLNGRRTQLTDDMRLNYLTHYTFNIMWVQITLSWCHRLLLVYFSCVFFVPLGLPSGPLPPTQEVHHPWQTGGVHRHHGNGQHSCSDIRAADDFCSFHSDSFPLTDADVRQKQRWPTGPQWPGQVTLIMWPRGGSLD